MAVPTFLSLKKQYGQLWHTAEIKPEWRSRLEAAANKIIVNKPKYLRVEAETGVPWYVVGIWHMRESGCNFSTHLHNGDSLKAKTWRVPAGRPIGGKPPYDWYFSAADALKMKGLDKIPGWDIETICYQTERYNGFGYRLRGLKTLSPYLWQGTSHYGDHDSPAGKFVRDGVYDPKTVDAQCGALGVLKVLEEMGEVSFAVKRTVRETVKGDRTIGALLGVIVTTVIGLVMTLMDFIGRLLDILPGHVDQTELAINTAGKVSTWLGIPLPIWFSATVALCGVTAALIRTIQAKRFVIPAADKDTETV